MTFFFFVVSGSLYLFDPLHLFCPPPTLHLWQHQSILHICELVSCFCFSCVFCLFVLFWGFFVLFFSVWVVVYMSDEFLGKLHIIDNILEQLWALVPLPLKDYYFY